MKKIKMCLWERNKIFRTHWIYW